MADDDGKDDGKPDDGKAADDKDDSAKDDSKSDDGIDWKAMARKHERDAKNATSELDKVRKANQTEQEKAIEEAKAEGRKSALGEGGERLAAAEIKAALVGIVPDPKSIVEDLNLSRYVTAEGDVDEAAVKALREKYAALGNSKRPPSFDGGAKDKDAPGSGSFLTQAIRDRRSA